MEKAGTEQYESYRKEFFKYDSYDSKKFKWNTSINESTCIDDNIISLVPKNAKILEVGCGNGILAESLMNKRQDITFYHGVDFVEEGILEATKKNIRDAKFYRANFWDVLSEVGEWNFVISEGALFTCTELQHRSLLMDLLDSAAEMGFIVLTIITKKPKVAMLDKSLENSINTSEYYLRGPNQNVFDLPPKMFNHPFWIIREGIKNKIVPNVPKKLKGLPKDNPTFKNFFRKE